MKDGVGVAGLGEGRAGWSAFWWSKNAEMFQSFSF